MTDNGPATRSKLLPRTLDAIAIRHIFTRCNTPRTSDKAERFIGTSVEEWAYARPFRRSKDRTAALDVLATLLQLCPAPLGHRTSHTHPSAS